MRIKFCSFLAPPVRWSRAASDLEIVNFTLSRNLNVKSTGFQDYNILNAFGLLMKRCEVRSIFYR